MRMDTPSEDALDGISRTETYADGTVVRVFITRTAREAYPSGWAYTLHYGATDPDPPRTLDDGTIRRYDNAHERTNGHELHVAPDPEPQSVDFPGMVALYERFWTEIPRTPFEID